MPCKIEDLLVGEPAKFLASPWRTTAL